MKNLISSGLFPVILFTAIILNSCEKADSDDQPGDPVNITTEIYQKEIIDSANRFAFGLFRPAISGSKGSENIMISPFSVTSALSMTLNGASGETFNAMIKALGIEEKTLDQINATYLKLMTDMVPVDKRVIVEIANSVWVEKRLTVKQKFITDLKTWYMAEARNIDVLDPAAVDIVNSWIEEKTHNKIVDMLDYLDPDLAMLIINAVYFNGKWRYQFDKSDTRQETFYPTASSPVNVSMMHLTENLKVSEKNNVTLVEIPYGQGNYTMVVALPGENQTAAEVAAGLSPELWQEWMNLLSENTHKVNLSMPRFRYEYKRLLNKDLTDLGMGIAFTSLADFSKISDQDLMINRVLHQTFIETNEEGTEAAAATVVEITVTSAGPDDPISVRLDRPFLYFIRETSTGTILFTGKVGNPSL